MSVASTTALVFVHGLFSSPATWSKFEERFAEEPDVADTVRLYFSYSTPRASFSPVRRIPDFNDIADSLAVFLDVEAGDIERLVIVTHSQGGLIVQRYLARMLNNARGERLARIVRIVMFACPNSGSDLALTTRRVFSWLTRNPQERELRPINDAVTQAQRAVHHSVVAAQEVSPHTCPITIVAYAGESDGVVTSAAATSVFRDVGVLPGDHSSIIQPDSRQHRSFTALLKNIREAFEQPLRSGADQEPPSATSPRAGEMSAAETPAAETPAAETPAEEAPSPSGGRALGADPPEYRVVYDSDMETAPFRSWGYFASRGIAMAKFPFSTGGMIAIRSTAGEDVGVNKALPLLRGSVSFEYRVDESGAFSNHVYFAVIPMQGYGPGRGGLIEVGSETVNDPVNARSPFRQRYFVPREHRDDRQWHEALISFNFTAVDTASYAIFAPRINEGIEKKADATVHVRRVRVWTSVD